MAAIHRLTDLKVQRAAKDLGDGGGLRLIVSGGGAKKWVFRYTRRGKVRQMGLGAYPGVSLAEARRAAADARAMLQAGIDPLDQRDQEARQQALEAAGVPTFTSLAAAYIRAHRRGWINPKHRRQWVSTLKAYARPALGAVPVDEITAEQVLAVLRPIWHSKTETATRVQKRMERVLDLAVSRGYRADNPARWTGHLQNELSAPAKVKRQRNGGVEPHHPAMPFAMVPSFYQELRQADGLAALALRLLILTACRTSEVLGATWEEITLADAVWTIPARRMKAKREHRVPLTDDALAILAKLPRISGEPWLFPGQRRGRPLSNMSMLVLMRKRGYGVGGARGDYVPHGFRSSFRDYCGEISAAPRHVAEAALAHVNADKVEAAYLRSDLFDRRRRLMQEWSDFVTSPAAQVLSLDQHREQRQRAASA